MQEPAELDPLKIPAYMRRRSIGIRKNRPLLLTALDRKRAGVQIAPKKPRRSRRSMQERPARIQSLFENIIEKKRVPKNHQIKRTAFPPRRRITAQGTGPLFEEPMIGGESFINKASIGTITHFFHKISVGVILLTSPLKVGEMISYESGGGQVHQIVRSMQINRAPVFEANAGDDVGIQLKSQPAIGSEVWRG